MYTIPVQMFVQFMLQNDLIICAFRVNMCTTEREITKTEENAMTRFEREISGSLGEFWKKNAEEEVRKAVAQADTQATVEADGAIRWNSNGRYLMDDFCEKLEYAGYAFDREATATKRDVQNAESLARYCRNDRGLSGEALAEARAAFGEGTTVVDVLTGKKTRL